MEPGPLFRRPRAADVAGAIHPEDTKRIFHRGRPLLEKSNQQDRGNAHKLPAPDEKVEGTGGESEQRSKRKKMQQQKETEKAGLAMKVCHREAPDQSRQHHSHAEKRQRQPVRDQHHGESIIMHSEPVAEGDRYWRGAGCGNAPEDRE